MRKQSCYWILLLIAFSALLLGCTNVNIKLGPDINMDSYVYPASQIITQTVYPKYGAEFTFQTPDTTDQVVSHYQHLLYSKNWEHITVTTGDNRVFAYVLGSMDAYNFLLNISKDPTGLDVFKVTLSKRPNN